MLSRKREKKNRYAALATDDHDDIEAGGDADLDHGLDIESGDAEELTDLEGPARRAEGEETATSK